MTYKLNRIFSTDVIKTKLSDRNETKKKVKTIIDIISQLQGFLFCELLNDLKHRFLFIQYLHKYILLSISEI